MGLARSTYHDVTLTSRQDDGIIERIRAIDQEFKAYGYRRMCADLGHQGLVVNNKKVRRLMREHDLHARRRRRYITTTDSDHEQPIHPNLTSGIETGGPDQLWVADLTYISIISGFAYVAVILDA